MREIEFQLRRLTMQPDEYGAEVCSYAQTFLATYGGKLALEGAHVKHDVYAVEGIDPDTQTVVETSGILALSRNPLTEQSGVTVTVDPRANGHTPQVVQLMQRRIQTYRDLFGYEFPESVGQA